MLRLDNNTFIPSDSSDERLTFFPFGYLSVVQFSGNRSHLEQGGGNVCVVLFPSPFIHCTSTRDPPCTVDIYPGVQTGILLYYLSNIAF